MKTFIIIGAGVTGLSTAYHLLLQKAGKVIVLEKDFSGAGSSSRAAGITTGLLWSSTGVQARKKALELFAAWSQTFPDYHFHNEAGCLNLFSPELWKNREPLLPLYDEEKVSYEILDAATIHKRWPLLNPSGEFRGLWDPKGGYSEPQYYLPALRSQILKLNGEIREGVRVTDFLFAGKKITGVVTNGGDIKADEVICATYAWTNLLLSRIGIQLPVKSFIHQRYVTKPLNEPVLFPPMNADDFMGYIRPADGNRILMGVETPDVLEQPVENLDFNESSIPDRWDLAKEGKARFESLVPKIKDMEWETAKTGLINFSMDGEPIIGPIEGHPGLWVGLAFHSGGFSYSPVSGMLLAELAATGETSIPIAAFSPNRYRGNSAATDYIQSRVQQKEAVRRRH